MIARGLSRLILVEDACRGIDVDDSVAATRGSLTALDIPCVLAAAVTS